MIWVMASAQVKLATPKFRLFILLLLCTVNSVAVSDAQLDSPQASRQDQSGNNCSLSAVERLDFRRFHLTLNGLATIQKTGTTTTTPVPWSEHLQVYANHPDGRSLQKSARSLSCRRSTHQTEVSEVAVLVTPRRSRYNRRYYIEAIWDATNSDYRVEFPHTSGKQFDRQSRCRHLNDTIAGFDKDFNNPQQKSSSFSVLVMTQQLDPVRNGLTRSSDVQVTVNLTRLLPSDGNNIIFAAYNSTRNVTENCKQMYIPVERSEFKDVKIAEDVNSTRTQLTVSWYHHGNMDVGYIVAVGDDDCTTPNRSPPCVIVKNRTNVAFEFPASPLDELISKQLRIYLYKIVNIECPDTDIGDKLVHMFRGCSDTRNCLDCGYPHYSITESDIVTNITNDTQLTECDSYINTRELVSTTDVPNLDTSKPSPLTTSEESSTIGLTEHTSYPSDILTTPYTSGSNEFQTTVKEYTSNPSEVLLTTGTTLYSSDGMSTSKAIIIAIVIVSMILIILIFSLAILVYLCRHSCVMVNRFKSCNDHTVTKDDFTPKYTPNLYTVTTGHTVNQDDTCLEDTLSLQSVSINIKAIHTNCTAGSERQSTELEPMERKVLVIYSENTPKTDKKIINAVCCGELNSYGFNIMSHGLACIKESPSQWLEREISKATVVLCVCNKEFKEDWEFPQSTITGSLIQSLKRIISATVQQGKNLSKYAVVLLDPADRDCVPTMYLQSDSRQFIIDDVETIAGYVQGDPTYIISQ